MNNFFFIFGCWLLRENNGFARLTVAAASPAPGSYACLLGLWGRGSMGHFGWVGQSAFSLPR